MALDKVVDSAALDAGMTMVADAIRAKAGTAEPLTWPEGYKAAVEGIPSGGSGEDLLAARLSDTMTSYSSPDVQSVVEYGFGYQKQLKSVSLPNCATLKTGAFYECAALAELDLPALVTISNNNTFRNCSSLTEFISGSAFDSRIDASTFEGCSKITKIDLRHVSNLGIGGYAFACASLVTLIIRNTDFVAPMSVTTAFGASTTPMNQGAGYIYVPASMVGSYKTATNWATYADQIRAIEDYPEITGG